MIHKREWNAQRKRSSGFQSVTPSKVVAAAARNSCPGHILSAPLCKLLSSDTLNTYLRWQNSSYHQARTLSNRLLRLCRGFKRMWNHLGRQRTSLSSPPSWMTCPTDPRLWALIRHCFLHSSSCSRSRHIFICSMLALWFSLTIFCCSRNFWSPQRIRQTMKTERDLQTWPTLLQSSSGHFFSPCPAALAPRCSSCTLPYKKQIKFKHSIFKDSLVVFTNGSRDNLLLWNMTN